MNEIIVSDPHLVPGLGPLQSVVAVCMAYFINRADDSGILYKVLRKRPAVRIRINIHNNMCFPNSYPHYFDLLFHLYP